MVRRIALLSRRIASWQERDRNRPFRLPAGLSKGVPDWHFGIVRDDLRNRAYEEALRRAVFPGCTVLEIGTGSGLLAMMAARAGAARVITCEADPAVAMTARAIIAANGFADRVVVLNKHFSAVGAATDMGGRPTSWFRRSSATT